VPEPVPDGSPPLKYGVTNAPLWSKKMFESRQPPTAAFKNEFQF
jgi:hypothetical protein